MVLKRLKLFVLCLISASGDSLGADVIVNTESITRYKVYPIEPRSGFEPSGLTIKDGQLFTVSDKRNKIYRLEVQGDVAMMIPHITFDAMILGALNFDLEGITAVGNDFFVVSEAHHRMVKVKPNGDITWVPDGSSFYPSAFKDGLFQIFNAAIEGVVYLGNARFLLAVERQPRGLIEVQLDDGFSEVIWQKNHILNVSGHTLEKNRTPDLTGLYVHQSKIFALHRNAEIIHQWEKDEEGNYQEVEQWSFAHIVNAPENQYQDMQYGHAEGLAVDDDHFYVVIDNNLSAKAKQGNDARPMLIVIDR